MNKKIILIVAILIVLASITYFTVSSIKNNTENNACASDDVDCAIFNTAKQDEYLEDMPQFESMEEPTKQLEPTNDVEINKLDKLFAELDQITYDDSELNELL